MQLTKEQYFSLSGLQLHQVSPYPQIYSFDEIPKALPSFMFPIVDRKFSFVVLASFGAHEVYTSTLGRFHGLPETEITKVLNLIDEEVKNGTPFEKALSAQSPILCAIPCTEAVEDFLKNGYFVSSAGGFKKLVIVRQEYMFDSVDRMLARRFNIDLRERQTFNPRW